MTSNSILLIADAIERLKIAIKIKHCEKCEQGAWFQLGITYIHLFEDEGIKDHLGSSLKFFEKPLKCVSNINQEAGKYIQHPACEPESGKDLTKLKCLQIFSHEKRP